MSPRERTLPQTHPLFSLATRRADLDAAAAGPVDLLVIGGGITGAGIARDAAMRGIRTCLVDAGDFGHGASSRSSRLIHGGLRYLEHGWLRLVFEASRERRILLQIAPHLVHPLPFVFPVHAGSRVGRARLAAGLWLYDLLSLFRNVHAHRMLSRRAVQRIEPHLRDRDLVGGAVYYDGWCDDARLVLANVRSAHRHGAMTASYGAVTALEKAGGRVRGAVVRDVVEERRVTVHAHVTVNAAGPWADALRQLDDAAATPLLRPTKGVHLAVPRRRVGNTGALTLTSPLDGRVMFVLPWGDVTMIGTTDTDFVGAADDVGPSAEDVTYLLRSTNAFFPDARLGGDDVIAAWAGLRPLLQAEGAASTAEVPREHRIVESATGLLTIAGGKLTTYRSMAAELVDVVAAKLHALDGRRIPAARTDREPLPGGEVADLEQLVEELSKERVPEPVARHLVETYGSEAPAVGNLAAREPALAKPLLDGWPALQAEVVYQARREMALTVSDVLIRRTHLFHCDAGQGTGAAPSVAGLLARELGWDAGREAEMLAAYLDEVKRMRLAITSPAGP
ncbi:MAG TPA: glycerol-3-phosphate dehydrogenase/oxidase [Gemmatimonadales bacterium]|nr:glycerol-3-phosphate dehydrogenase/oxidase [Gemmatimonadales bacterium]